jgi:hypothetical protein
MTRLVDLTEADIQELPIDRLALLLLKHCDDGGE